VPAVLGDRGAVAYEFPVDRRHPARLVSGSVTPARCTSRARASSATGIISIGAAECHFLNICHRARSHSTLGHGTRASSRTCCRLRAQARAAQRCLKCAFQTPPHSASTTRWVSTRSARRKGYYPARGRARRRAGAGARVVSARPRTRPASSRCRRHRLRWRRRISSSTSSTQSCDTSTISNNSP